MRGSRRALKGAGPSWGSGAQESFSDRKCFPTQSFSRQTVGVLLQKGFLNLIRKWNPMVFQHIGYFRDNTGRRTEVVCDDQPNALRPVTHGNGGGGDDRTHYSRVRVKVIALDAIYRLCNRQCGGQDWGTGTLGSYVQSVLPWLHHVERQQ